MIKAELKKDDEMTVMITGDVNDVLNELAAITGNLYKGISKQLGSKEAKKTIKEAFKHGLKIAERKVNIDD